MNRLPDFMIIGAMKCATSTLHDQLAAQPGIVMSDPKEPYFFSDDPHYAKGMAWYTGLFRAAGQGDLCGESTTHYTKLPTYPETIARIQAHVPQAKFIYIMRHPIDRLVSQYIHQWTEREISVPLHEAISAHSELVSYSQYAMQLQPYFDAFGRERVLPVFFDKLRGDSQAELERVARFIGYEGVPKWYDEETQKNVSSERMRANPLRDMIVDAPGLKQLRQYLIPKRFRTWVRTLWTMQKRPELSAEMRAELADIFDRDLAVLGSWLGVELTCANFKQVTTAQTLEWKD